MRAVTSYFPDKNYGEEMIIWIPRYTKILTIDMHNYNELRPLHKEIMMIVFLFQYSLTNFLAKLLFPKIYIYFCSFIMYANDLSILHLVYERLKTFLYNIVSKLNLAICIYTAYDFTVITVTKIYYFIFIDHLFVEMTDYCTYCKKLTKLHWLTLMPWMRNKWKIYMYHCHEVTCIKSHVF